MSLLFFLASGKVEANKTLYFTPLPTEELEILTKKNIVLSNQIQKAVKQPVELNIKKDYSDIINGVINGKIDLLTLGPLPYLQLKKQFPHVKPILLLKRQSGKASYRCMLTKFRLDTPNPKAPLRIALPQPMSTCGYFKTKFLVKRGLNKELSEQKYYYAGSHAQAIESVLAGKTDYAGSCSCYVKDYLSLGIEIVAKSDLVPGFGLFVNTQTVDESMIQAIQHKFLSFSDKDLADLGGIYSYGFTQIKGQEYQSLSLPDDIPNQGNFSP